jgi:hypothetical protein
MAKLKRGCTKSRDTLQIVLLKNAKDGWGTARLPQKKDGSVIDGPTLFIINNLRITC